MKIKFRKKKATLIADKAWAFNYGVRREGRFWNISIDGYPRPDIDECAWWVLLNARKIEDQNCGVIGIRFSR